MTFYELVRIVLGVFGIPLCAVAISVGVLAFFEWAIREEKR